MEQRRTENGIKLEASSKVLDHIAGIGFDPQFGARPLQRILQREVLNKLSKEILAGHINRDGIVGIDLGEDNTIDFINLDQVKI
jgi:ATP-dependent Clp protease ATP-binding subunit ClpB